MPPLPKPPPPEIGTAAAFRKQAGEDGWPILLDETCRFDHPVLSQMFSLWNAEAAGGIPARGAMTARKLQPFMRYIAIYERIGEGVQRRYRVRLMGSGIVQYYGELTGRYFDDFVPEKFLPRWYALSDLPLLSRKPVRLLLRTDTFNKSYMAAEYFCAPLTAESGLVKFVLIGMHFDGRRPWSDIEAEARAKLGLSGDD